MSDSNELDKAMAEALEAVERRQKDSDGQPSDSTPSAPATPETPAPPNDDPGAQAADADSGALTDALVKQAETRDQLVRMAADFDNFRKRSRKELEEARRFGIEILLRDVLPVIDNLQRALEASGAEDSALSSGVKMVHKQFEQVLAKHGVESFTSVGSSFDPELHEALSQQPTNDQPAGTIVHEMERGYRIHERLLRPAKVAVAMPPAEATPESENAADAEPETGDDRKPS